MSRGLNMVTLSFVFLVGTAWAEDNPPVKPFDVTGLVIDVQDLFPVAAREGNKVDRSRSQTTLKDVAARALVTDKGVYAFLETPENQRALKDVKSGTAVNIKGRLLKSGALLHIDS